MTPRWLGTCAEFHAAPKLKLQYNRFSVRTHISPHTY
jgi:hypothetical protein